MNRRLIAVAGLLVLGVAGAGGWHLNRLPAGDCRLLKSLRPETAVADAKAALAKGDPRLLGIYGYALTAPGADRGEAPDAVIRPIECTSDVIVSERHGRLQDRAQAYARLYNRVMLGAGPRG